MTNEWASKLTHSNSLISFAAAAIPDSTAPLCFVNLLTPAALIAALRKLLPFTRQDGEQPYVAWLGDAGLKAATAQRIQHRPATACGDQGASSHSDWTSEASTC